MIFAGKRPRNLGVTDGQLAACPRKPNCVSSQASGQAAIPALPLNGDPASAMQALAEVVKQYPRTTIVEQSDNYLYAEFKTALMGYVDDVEFYCDGQAIQVRSASRLGYSDLGANRKRIEDIRRQLAG